MAVITPIPKTQFLDAAGAPLAGGFVYTYQAGTTTPQATYTDATGATPNSNPIVLDARGEANIWLGEATYKMTLCNAQNTEIWTVDYISAPTTAVSPVLSGNVTISTDSSGPALKITQTGTGDVLRVQDSADPDSTPFVINASGYVGIGTVGPTEVFQIANAGKIFISDGATGYSYLYGDSTSTYLTAEGARSLVFKNSGSETARITATGSVGIGTASPAVKLDVVGAIGATGDIASGAAVSAVTTLSAGTSASVGTSLTVGTTASVGTTLSVDTIQEKTASAGVTVGGVLCKNALIPSSSVLISAGTAQATTSGTNFEFTSIPTWVKRISLMFSDVSLSASANILVQLGVSTYTTSGYVSNSAYVGVSTGNANSTSAFIIAVGGNSNALTGIMTIDLLNSTTYAYVANFTGTIATNIVCMSGGNVTLSGIATKLKVLNTGADTFDAGSINILYE